MAKKTLVPISIIMIFFFGIIQNSFAQTKKKSNKKTVVAHKSIAKSTSTILKKIPGTRVKITTDSGIIVVRLYDSTPLHRDNFIKLVNEKFYDSLLFHRVIQSFMIQGGDPLSKTAPAGIALGAGGSNMQRIPAEFNLNLIHKKGALAAARDGNPAKSSSACQFYIVDGRKYSDAELNQFEAQANRKYTPAQRKEYTTIGGVPFLDMNYTVFGEVETGLPVIDKIASAPKNSMDRPIGDIRMKMEVLK